MEATMFGMGSDPVELPWRNELRLALVHAQEVIIAYGNMTDHERIACALLFMSAQREFDNGQGTVKDVVELVRTNFAPVYPSKAPELGVPDQRRWKDGFDAYQFALRVGPLVRTLQSSEPMHVFTHKPG